MAKVVLLSPPFINNYMRNARCDFVSLSKSSWYPIWLGQAGSYLEGKGHQTKLMDAQIVGMSWTEAIEQIKQFAPDLVAVYTGRLSEDNDVAFGDHLEELGFKVVFVGPYTSIDPKKLLGKAKKANLAIRKEFDLPLEELARGEKPENTANVIIKEAEGDYQEVPSRPLYKTEILDQFPLTSEYFHRQLNIYNYKTPSELYPFIDIMSGRGCAWGRCNFCLWVQTFVPGSVYNLRSIEHFMQEFDYIVRFMPEVRSVMIQDDMITNKRAREVSEGLLQRGHRIRWSCYAKPNSHLTLETLQLMKKSGCLNLHVGFESGDNGILETMDKGSTVEQAEEFARLAHDAGLQIHADFAIGHLGETSQTIEKTIQLAKKINPHTAQFQIMIPFEGTTFINQLREKGALNSEGRPTYECLGGPSSKEMEDWAKHAYRTFYFSPSYLKKILSNPKDYFFNRLDQYVHAIPAVTWKRWVR